MRHLVPAVAIAAVLMTACSRAPEMDEQLKADLQAASAGGIELAPRSAGTNVVSAIESKQPVQPQVTPVRRTVAPARTPRPETPQVTQASAQPAPTATPEPTAQRPLPASSVSPPPPGGYKSVGEVIRNAPFPIKPATTTKKP